ncbi:MAG: alpha/beta hydrolase [Lautropia sp.]
MTAMLRITRDLVYGTGRIGCSGTSRSRPLTLDLYQPGDCRPGDRRPALVMAFGGAFHRGDKRADEFEQGGQRNTPVATYCARFAERGFVAASIDYRLVQEDPDPGTTPVIGDPDAVPMSRVAQVRGLLGLPPITPRVLCAGIEAASDDFALAFGWLREHAGALGIDPGRIAIGGFSAGARSALNCGYGERVGAAALVSLSGFMASDDLARHLVPGRGLPPALLVTAGQDLDYVAAQAQPMQAALAAAGIDCEAWLVPDASHFYPAESIAQRRDGARSTVEAAIAAFLARVLGPVLEQR